MRPNDAYALGLRAAQAPAEASQGFLSSILSANSNWPEYLKEKANETLDVAPWTLLALAKSFAAERANTVAADYTREAKAQLKRHFLGK